MDTAINLTYSDMQLKTQIATVTRLLHNAGILDYSGHISARAPGRNALFIQQRTDPRSEVAPSGILLVDFDGTILEGAPGKPPSETAIHIEIYKSRPDVQAIIHTHMEMAILFTGMKDTQLQPIRSRALRWKHVPIHRDPSHIKSEAQGKALADTLGQNHAVLIKGHGAVLVAESVPGILVDCIHFEENARAYLQILNSGREPEPLTEEELGSVNEQREHHIGKLWKYFVRTARKNGELPADWKLEV